MQMLCPTGNRSDRCEYLTKVHLAHHRAVGGGRGGRGHHRARRGARGRQPRLLGRGLAHLEVSALGLAPRRPARGAAAPPGRARTRDLGKTLSCRVFLPTSGSTTMNQ